MANWLNDISMVDPETGWSVGDGGVILNTTDGVNWNNQESGTSERLLAVSAVDDKVAWAVGRGGTIRKTTNGGNNWSRQGLLSDHLWVTDVVGVDPQTAWIIVGYNTVMKTADGGYTWNRQQIEGRELYPASICAADADNAWIVGRSGCGDPGKPFVFKTVDGGGNWRRREVDAPRELNSICRAADGTLWAVGDRTVVKSTDNGDAWISLDTEQSDPPHESIRYLSVSAVDSETAWIASVDGSITRTIDGGKSWSRTSIKNEAKHKKLGNHSIFAFDPDTAIIANGGILKTSDASVSWTSMLDTVTGSGLRDISAVDANTAWAVGDYGTILKTTDGGTTWKKQDSRQPHSILYGVHAVDRETAWAVGKDGVILKTEDGGTNWNQQAVPERPCFLEDISAVDGKTAWAVGRYGTILKTSNGGRTWDRQEAGIGLYQVSAIDERTVWAAGDAYTIIKTGNGGSTWEVVHSLAQGEEEEYEFPGYIPSVNCLSAVDGKNAFAYSVSFQGGGRGFMKTVDGGRTWTRFAEGSEGSLVLAVDTQNILVVGTGVASVTSNGGDKWHSGETGSTNVLNAVAIAGGSIWLVGDGGTILKNDD